jgi:NADH-quinone oxidoreductase subunit K
VCVGVIDLCIGRWERGEVTMVERVCLMLFGGLSVLCAGGVLLTSNPVHSVLFLVLSFMNAAGMMRLLEAEFRALLFIVVYVGGVCVIVVLMSIERLLLSVNRQFVAWSVYLDDVLGQVISLLVLTVAAAESSIGLSILVVFFRVRGSIDMSTMQRLHG